MCLPIMFELWIISAKLANLVNDESKFANIVSPSPSWKLNPKDISEKHILNKKRNHFIFLGKAVTQFSAQAKIFIFSADLSLEVIRFNFLKCSGFLFLFTLQEFVLFCFFQDRVERR